LSINQNQKHSGLDAENNGFNNVEIRQRIIEATSGLSTHYFTKMAKRMSTSNADLLARFIIQNKMEISCSYPSPAASPIVPLVASFSSGPNVVPPSLLIIATGSSAV
jgi:hypothetical protein